MWCHSGKDKIIFFLFLFFKVVERTCFNAILDYVWKKNTFVMGFQTVWRGKMNLTVIILRTDKQLDRSILWYIRTKKQPFCLNWFLVIILLWSGSYQICCVTDLIVTQELHDIPEIHKRNRKYKNEIQSNLY